MPRNMKSAFKKNKLRARSHGDEKQILTMRRRYVDRDRKTSDVMPARRRPYQRSADPDVPRRISRRPHVASRDHTH